MVPKIATFFLAAFACSESVESFASFVKGKNVALKPDTPFSQRTITQSLSTGVLKMSSTSSPFELTIQIPPSNSGLNAEMKIQPILDVPSEIIEVRYKLPFGLDVAPKDNLAICTKDGPGGEKVGDVLRYTSCWSLGLPQGEGLVSTAASFAGGVSWQCSLFDVMKASQWGEVVEALTSNVDSRTDEVVLLFERPLPTSE